MYVFAYWAKRASRTIRRGSTVDAFCLVVVVFVLSVGAKRAAASVRL